MSTHRDHHLSLVDPSILGPAFWDSFRKLNPRSLAKNPVMFVVEVVAAVTTILFLRDLLAGASSGAFENPAFSGQISAWLWITVLFANFAEAVAEGRGKAQAASLRRTRSETVAKRIPDLAARTIESVSPFELKPGDLVLVEAGDLIPSDGEIVE